MKISRLTPLDDIITVRRQLVVALATDFTLETTCQDAETRSKLYEAQVYTQPLLVQAVEDKHHPNTRHVTYSKKAGDST